jgi:alanine racemase
MDVTMVDASDVPGTITPGEEVIVYGTTAQEPSLVELAKSADTIAYELLTRISPRVRRIFIGEISGRSAGRA